ncbi:MAG: hypothetical protein B7O98_06335 [Zestosphaera tikiterensis]|uniref:DNA-binding protein n=1 Tax=Zestosphaera tikiterensis TaxID=1973259 RepID=A0A2R7Y433_9CREN|nr:MAG: hypothetical protein B7O98_06335 [Zestosphaera tikiterensis]
MSVRFAIADTCFIIDWARFRYRDLMFKLFNIVYVSESVLKEIKSERTVEWVASALASGNMSIYTETSEELEEARKLTEESRKLRSLIPVDLPEALCLVIGRRRGYVVLTENRGAIMAVDFITPYKDVVVWRALEILTAAVIEGMFKVSCNELNTLFKAYEEDTRHFFPRRDLTNALELIKGRICG